MPHFGLIDEHLDAEETSLLRARLHVRGANTRLARGHIADAVAALYDAFSTAMELSLPPEERSDDRTMYRSLRDIGILRPKCIDDFDFLEYTLDRAIEGTSSEIDLARFLDTIDSFLTRLGIIPFASSSLPQGEAITA